MSEVRAQGCLWVSSGLCQSCPSSTPPHHPAYTCKTHHVTTWWPHLVLPPAGSGLQQLALQHLCDTSAGVKLIPSVLVSLGLCLKILQWNLDMYTIPTPLPVQQGEECANYISKHQQQCWDCGEGLIVPEKGMGSLSKWHMTNPSPQPWSTFIDPHRLATVGSLVQVQVDPLGQQKLTLGQGDKCSLASRSLLEAKMTPRDVADTPLATPLHCCTGCSIGLGCPSYFTNTLSQILSMSPKKEVLL